MKEPSKHMLNGIIVLQAIRQFERIKLKRDKYAAMGIAFQIHVTILHVLMDKHVTMEIVLILQRIQQLHSLWICNMKR